MTPSAGRLIDRVAVVTGASRGIGAAVARRFAAEGAAVAIGHEPSAEMSRLANEVAAGIRADGGTAVTIGADLEHPDGPGHLVAATRDALGPVDLIVANAAASGRSAWDEIPIDHWDQVQAVNVRGTWLLARAAKDDLIASGHGAIITLTSVMAMTGQAGALHYTTSKAAILGMTRALARELGPTGVRVNAVMPGAIRTEHEQERSPDPDEVAGRVLPKQSLQRRGFADDLAGAFVFLASNDADFITGQVVCVDGGWVMY